jgi:hypothetical protein
LNEVVDRESSWIWGAENLNLHEDAPLHPAKCIVWSAVSPVGILGPAFLKENINSKLMGVGFFNWPNPSSRTMALGSTQPLTRCFPTWGPRPTGGQFDC